MSEPRRQDLSGAGDERPHDEAPAPPVTPEEPSAEARPVADSVPSVQDAAPSVLPTPSAPPAPAPAPGPAIAVFSGPNPPVANGYARQQSPPFPYAYPPHYAPYATPPMFAYPPDQRPPTNGIALAGLLTAVFFWPAGLVLSAIGLHRSKQLGGAGRGQAVAGLVIAPISAAITVLVAIGLIAAATAIGNANSSMFSDAPDDPGCTLILSALPGIPGRLQNAPAGPQDAIDYLAGLDASVQDAENAAVNVEVSDDLDKVDGDIANVTEDLQAIAGGGTAASTGVGGDIAELDTDSGALQSLCTTA